MTAAQSSAADLALKSSVEEGGVDELVCSEVPPYQAVRIRTDGEHVESPSASQEESYSPAAENPLRRILQPFGWHLHAQPRTKRKLLQSTSSGPYSSLTVAYNGKICILFKVKRLAIRYRNNTFLDLTERVFGPSAQVDTKGSVCTKEKATLSLRLGDVEDIRALVIRLQMSNTYYESVGQNWFTLDSVHIHYNWTHEATFPRSSHTDSSANWHITFTDFQVAATKCA
ncbi:V-type proton ATPase subunit S1-like [Sinocyclocheilus rhinocerous]|uniref:V-type proton ATPase subunit S1-like n=1 Tax=Sinocyclocheilus rhinocerous TaxID=307959 RepID=UPI0007B900E6|nr:PREDICTED: V-type proton ATPase subunit S1-like [Sinocyclocheilus rhinocerous]